MWIVHMGEQSKWNDVGVPVREVCDNTRVQGGWGIREETFSKYITGVYDFVHTWKNGWKVTNEDINGEIVGSCK